MRLIVHNAVSLDGRLTGFDVDMETYYRLAGTWREDATLCGSGTILAAPEGRKHERAGAAGWQPEPGDKRPLLVVADSRGRVRCWQALRRAGVLPAAGSDWRGPSRSAAGWSGCVTVAPD